MAKNTLPELYDEPEVGMKTAPTQEETLMNESDLLRGLLAAASEKDSESAYERIQIRRSGVLKFEFRIRPIYTATVDEDRAKTWDNKQAQEALNILQGVDMVDAVLLSGEKDRIIDRINEISGYDDDQDETAKN